MALSDKERRDAAEKIIKKATLAAVSTSSLFSFLGGTVTLRAIAVGMARQIAELFDKELSEQQAAEIIQKIGPPSLGVTATMVVGAFLPVLGNISNAAISHGYIERLGWALFDYFLSNEHISEYLNAKNVFVCYSHKDGKFAARLLDHLRCFELDGEIETFIDTSIQPGGLWRHKIADALQRAKLAIVLISPDFLLSKFIREIELPTILEHAKRQHVVVFPVVTSPTPKTTAVDKLLSFQSPVETIEPLSKMKPAAREEAFKQIAEAAVDTLKTVHTTHMKV